MFLIIILIFCRLASRKMGNKNEQKNIKNLLQKFQSKVCHTFRSNSTDESSDEISEVIISYTKSNIFIIPYRFLRKCTTLLVTKVGHRLQSCIKEPATKEGRCLQNTKRLAVRHLHHRLHLHLQGRDRVKRDLLKRTPPQDFT